jgi:hypothetical protein
MAPAEIIFNGDCCDVLKGGGDGTRCVPLSGPLGVRLVDVGYGTIPFQRKDLVELNGIEPSAS